jgi:hypothetical protein
MPEFPEPPPVPLADDGTPSRFPPLPSSLGVGTIDTDDGLALPPFVGGRGEREASTAVFMARAVRRQQMELESSLRALDDLRDTLRFRAASDARRDAELLRLASELKVARRQHAALVVRLGHQQEATAEAELKAAAAAPGPDRTESSDRPELEQALKTALAELATQKELRLTAEAKAARAAGAEAAIGAFESATVELERALEAAMKQTAVEQERRIAAEARAAKAGADSVAAGAFASATLQLEQALDAAVTQVATEQVRVPTSMALVPAGSIGRS